ncbi:MAG: DamX protein [Candidatus Azotimanducaceae bacterium]|jgi:DamX protein
MRNGISDTDTLVNLGGQSSRPTNSSDSLGNFRGSEFVGNGDLLNLPDKLACLVTYGEMFILVSGGTGQGKSLAKAQMLEQIADSLPVLELKVEQRNRQVLTEVLLVGFRLNASQRDSNSGLAQLRRFSRDLANSSRKAVVVVDDAHCLTNAALKTLLDLVEKAGLGLILFAEPSIDRRAAIKAAAGRIYRCPLERLDQAQVRSYLRRKQPLLSEDLNQAQLDDILMESKGIPGEIDRRVEDILHGPAQSRGLPMIHVSMVMALLLIGGAALWFEQVSASKVTRQFLAVDAEHASEASLLPTSSAIPTSNVASADGQSLANKDLINKDLINKDLINKDPVNEAAAPPEPRVIVSVQPAPNSRNVSMAVIMPTGASEKLMEVVSGGGLGGIDASVSLPNKRPSLAALNAEDADWVYAARPGEYTLQLMGSYSLEGIKAFINSTSEPERFAYFVTRRGSDIWYVLTAGRYPSRDAAIAAINVLPPALAGTKPWARSVESIRASLDS